MEILGYLAAIIMGLSLGLIGGGGSILTVPILVYLFKVDALLATSYSLFIVGLTALFGGVSYFKKSEVDFKTGFIFATPSFIGVYLTRSYILPSIPESMHVAHIAFSKALLIMVIFALLMLLASVSMIKSNSQEKNRSQMSPSLRNFIIAIEGLVVGGVTGLVGAGGGFLIIPALVVLVGLPMRKAVGTSLFIIAVKSAVGFAGDLQRSIAIDWILLVTLSAIALVGLFLGIKFSNKFSDKYLKKGFGYFVLLMGSVILIDQIFKL